MRRAATVDARRVAAARRGRRRRRSRPRDASSATRRSTRPTRPRSKRYVDARPVLRAVSTAAEAIPGMRDRMLLHSGPPIEWERMCGPMQGAVVGALLYEGWAATPEEARALAASGDDRVRALPRPRRGRSDGRRHQPVDAGVGRRGCRAGRRRAFSNFNEGLGKVLRFGAYSDEVIERLRWMRDELAPALAPRSRRSADSSSSR